MIFIISNAITKEDLLKYALMHDIIDIEDISDRVNAMEDKMILDKHPYKIWQAEDGRFKTYVDDESKKFGKRLIAKTTIEKLNAEIIKYYKDTHEIRLKIYQIYNDWIEFAREEESLSGGTIDRYDTDYQKFIANTEFSKKDITTITENDVIKFLKSIVVQHKKANDKITRKCFTNIKIVVNGIFSFAKSERDIPCVSIAKALQNFKLPDNYFKYVIHKDEEEVYSIDEAIKLATHIVNKYQNRQITKSTRELGILFLLLTGIRIGELVTLKVTDESDKKLYIQRTESKRKVNGKTEMYIKDYPKTPTSMDGIELSNSAYTVWKWIRQLNALNGVKSEFMFYEEDIGRLHEHNFRPPLKNLCKECDIKYRSPHKFRKTYSSILFANNVEKKIVQKQMRHKDISTTERHYDFSVRNRDYKREQLEKADIIGIESIKCKSVI